jgi:predicted dehydrogenase/NADPH:quinone reductase-like Zn-dependent oxidoreductase
MRQVFRRVIDPAGKVSVEDVPTPTAGPFDVLVAAHYSLISAGTESATLRKTPLALAKQVWADPWMRGSVKEILTSGGLRATTDRVLDQLYLPRPVGYSGAGVVIETGAHVDGIRPGQRVAYAACSHAEVVAAARTLVVPIPDEVDDRSACFVTVGAICIQGVRRSGAELGDTVVVVGQGLIGQLTNQILLAAGADVIGIDVSGAKLEQSRAAGVRRVINSTECDPVDAVRRFTGGFGADRVIICAQSNDPALANQGMEMARAKGRMTFVGLVPMELERMPFFLGELDIGFSRAYGPGMYDPRYESGAIDYPRSYVRWTAQENMAEFLRLAAIGKVRVDEFIHGIYPVEQAQDAYARVLDPRDPTIAIVLQYQPPDNVAGARTVVRAQPRAARDTVRCALVGVGNFTRAVHLPNLTRHPHATVTAVCTRSHGDGGLQAALRFGVERHVSDLDAVLGDADVDAVLIGTRHDAHGPLTVAAARAGKAVFCEKPPAMNAADLASVVDTVRTTGVPYAIGYNRRYAPLTRRLLDALRERPLIVHYTVSIQALKADHWTLDPDEGGGRLLGESDHFFDLMHCIAGSRPESVAARAIISPRHSAVTSCNFSVQVGYANGSVGTLTYTDQGHPQFPRERVQVFSGGTVLTLDDFARLEVLGKRKAVHRRPKGKGHIEEIDAFIRTCRGQSVPELAGIDAAAAAFGCCLAALESMRTSRTVMLDGDGMPQPDALDGLEVEETRAVAGSGGA